MGTTKCDGAAHRPHRSCLAGRWASPRTHESFRLQALLSASPPCHLRTPISAAVALRRWLALAPAAVQAAPVELEDQPRSPSQHLRAMMPFQARGRRRVDKRRLPRRQGAGPRGSGGAGVHARNGEASARHDLELHSLRRVPTSKRIASSEAAQPAAVARPLDSPGIDDPAEDSPERVLADSQLQAPYDPPLLEGSDSLEAVSPPAQ